MRKHRLLIASAVAAVLVSATARADIDISKQPTENMSCSGGVCTPTAKNAVLNVSDLASMLASGDLTVQTGNGNDTTAGITIVNSFSWANSSRLTLTAKNNIAVKAPVTIAGNGALTITYAAGNPNGDLQFEKKGKIDFWDTSSSLVVNGNSYLLVNDLKALKEAVIANHSGNFALANDYDASVDGTYKNSPIRHGFRGNFEGLGHTIDALTIDDPKQTIEGPFNSVGLFNHVYSPGLLRDLRLTHVSVSAADYSRVGGIVGDGNGRIRNSSVQGSITGGMHSAAGCIAGVIDYTIHSMGACDVKVGSQGSAGGLVGDGAVTDSSAAGSVTGAVGALVGGLSGEGWMIDRSHSSATVVGGKRSRAGGLVGMLRGSATIKNSFATGSVSGGFQTNVGGLVGRASQDRRTYPTIQNSYALGAISGKTNSHVGGLIGYAADGVSLQTSFSTGKVSGGFAFVGGSVGYNVSADADFIYWDIDTSGTTNGCGQGSCDGVTGLVDAQLKSSLPAGFDPKIWGQSPSINNGYPYLLANPPQE
ncbi:MAG TPA: hypothetical protein VHW69_05985 [Rhizomicrobium sp.]|jgi:hypothetical protein|nr:hypothetical protein [Rhizomicrobium sp.]